MIIEEALKDSYAYIIELERKILADEAREAEIKAKREAEIALREAKSEAKPAAKRKAKPKRPDFHATIIEAERKISLQELFELFKATSLNVKANTKSLQPFVDYLKNRWLRIKEFYSLHYTTRCNDELTIACYKLAADLATTGFFTKTRIELIRVVSDEKDEKKENEEKKFDKLKSVKIIEPAHRYDLLIPNIVTRNQIFDNEPDEDFSLDGPLELHHFILDTPGYKHKLPTKPLISGALKPDTYIINVQTCMDYVSKNERTLVHTSRMIGGKEIVLSKTLSTRVIYHSHETLNLWNNITLIKTLESTSQSVGGALENLIEALKSASIVGHGSESIASPEAIQGIIKFQKYLIYKVVVDSANYATLMALHARDGHAYTFKSLWYKLLLGAAGTDPHLLFKDKEIIKIASYLHPFESDINGRTNLGYTCVNVIRGEFDDILKRHYKLLFGMLVDAQSSTTLENLNNEIIGNQTLITECMRENKLTPIKSDELELFTTDVCEALYPKDLDTQKVRLLINDHLFLFKLLCLLDLDQRITLVHNHLTTLFVANTIAKLKNLISGLKIINSSCVGEQAEKLQWEILSALGSNFLLKHLDSSKKLATIAAHLSPANFLQLIDKLDVGEGMASARRDQDNFLKELSPETLAAVRHLFPDKSIAHKTISLISSTTSAFFKRKTSDEDDAKKKPDKRQRTQSGSQSSAADADEFAATQVQDTFMDVEDSFQLRL